jgi:hypothetical protein
MYKKGIVDCLKLGISRSKNKSYLVGFGRQYEREQKNIGVCHG